MGIFSQTAETIGRLLSEKFLAGLRILTGSEKGRGEKGSKTPATAVTPNDEKPRTAPKGEKRKDARAFQRLGSNGNR